MSCGDIFLGLIAILFPPIAVWIKRGLCSADSFINILLCVLGYVPGLIHSWYIIASFPEQDHDYEPIQDPEGQRVTYVVVQGDGRRNYGTQGRGQGKHNTPRVPQENRPAQSAEGPSSGAGGDESAAPPSYSDVVKGDNKVQSHD